MDLSISPFKRLREATGSSKVDFYKSAGLSESALTFVEAGLYTANPPRADQELLRLCSLRDVPFDSILNDEYGAGTIPAATLAWQQAVRASLAPQLKDAYERAYTNPDETLTPIENLAHEFAGSKTAFCKQLKIQVAVLYQFDFGKSYSMPKTLYAALSDAGLTQRQLSVLEEEQQVYLRQRKHQLDTEKVALVD